MDVAEPTQYEWQGWTLVNFVDLALGAIGAAVEAVKDAASTVVNAVKDGMEWIQNEVILEILESIQSMILNVVNAFGEIISSIDPTVVLGSINHGISINGNDVSVTIENMRLSIILGGSKLNFHNLFGGFLFEHETLVTDHQKNRH